MKKILPIFFKSLKNFAMVEFICLRKITLVQSYKFSAINGHLILTATRVSG